MDDSRSPLEKRVEILSATEARLDGDTRPEVHSDGVAIAGTHSSQREAATGPSSDKSAAVLVQVQQVSAVHTANTERYDGKAAQTTLHLAARPIYRELPFVRPPISPDIRFRVTARGNLSD